MKITMRKIIALFICIFGFCTAFSISASADTGPKPSVKIQFKNMSSELCYATLLSEYKSTGPQSVWDGDEDHIYNYDLDIDTWKKFVEYKDTDGYYFLQIGWQVNETKSLNWSYYPPQKFKILLYFPDTDTFIVSGICERYAFDTYYTVDMEGINISSVDYDDSLSNNNRLNAYRSYRYSVEVISLIVRIVITIAIEMAIALLFGLRGKKVLLLLVMTNSATQIILNVILNIINYNSGPLSFTILYILLEIFVFVLESIIYSMHMNKISEKTHKISFYILYAFAANAISFVSGILVAHILPGIF